MKSSGVPLEHVVDVAVADAVIVERMSGRRVHLPSGRSYHLKYNPPQSDMKDDATGEALVQREDDKEAVNKARVLPRSTEPLIGYTRKWFETADRRLQVPPSMDRQGEEVGSGFFVLSGKQVKSRYNKSHIDHREVKSSKA